MAHLLKQIEQPFQEYADLLDSGQRAEVVLRLKEDIHRQRISLQTLYKDDVRKLVYAQSDYIDQIVTLFYRLAISSLPDVEKDKEFNMAIVASGGYGRRELCPYSDIDLLFLYEDTIDSYVIKLVNETLYFLWDLGFQVGHGCRSIKQSLQLARSDLTVCTSLIESRHIAGNYATYDRFYNTLLARVRKQGDAFVQVKIMEQAERHALYDHAVNLLEPNIKESPGGLRDYNLCLWAATVKYGRMSFDGLSEIDILSSAEMSTFINSVDFLLKVRNQLHIFCSRRSDVLAMDYQDPVAEKLGYKNKGTKSGSAQLMQDYYIHANKIRYLSQIFLHHCMRKDNKNKLRLNKKTDIEDGFYTRNGKLCLLRQVENIFETKPLLMMAVFKWCGEYKAVLSTDVKRLIQKNPALVDDDFRSSAHARDIFLSILRFDNSAQILRQMHEVHFLGRYIPEFAPLTCLAQRDLYHQFTVDEHTLKAIGHLESLSSNPKMTELAGLYNGLKNHELVKLALLFHDLGKTDMAEHISGSLEKTDCILSRMGLGPEQKKIIRFLVGKHLEINYLAQHHDLDDTHTIKVLADQVGSVEYLKMLYLVSYADIRSVGHDVWNDWKGLLLSDLYHRTAGFLQDKVPGNLKQKVLDSIPKEIDIGDVEIYFDSLPDRYQDFLSVEKVIKHLKLIAKKKSEEIQITYEKEDNFTELMVCTTNRRGVLAQIAGVLASQSINILGAQVNTLNNGIAIDTLQITDTDSKPITATIILEKVKSGLVSVLEGKQNLDALKPSRKRFLVLKKEAALPISTRIKIDNEFSPHFSVIQLVCRDRLGLLYDITRSLSEMGIDISMAKITTEAHRAIDTFYATDKKEKKISGHKRLEAIKMKLKNIIEKSE